MIKLKCYNTPNQKEHIWPNPHRSDYDIGITIYQQNKIVYYQKGDLSEKLIWIDADMYYESRVYE